MSDDGDEFDPSAAAAVALGEQADGDLDLADGDASDPDASRPDDGGDPDGSDGGETGDSSSRGAVALYLLPLFTASASGPSADTLREHGIGGWLADVFDGFLDYVLHFTDELGDELDDSLGPAGKIGRGLFAKFGEVTDDGGDSDDDSTEQGSGGGGEGAPVPGGDGI